MNDLEMKGGPTVLYISKMSIRYLRVVALPDRHTLAKLLKPVNAFFGDILPWKEAKFS